VRPLANLFKTKTVAKESSVQSSQVVKDQQHFQKVRIQDDDFDDDGFVEHKQQHSNHLGELNMDDYKQ